MGSAKSAFGRALAILESEAPTHAAMLRTTLSEIELRLETDDEAMSPAVVDGRLEAHEAVDTAAVSARASLSDVLALLDDELTVIDALRARRLHIIGTVPHLRRAARALNIFLHGLVRAPSGASLLGDLREFATTTEKRNS